MIPALVTIVVTLLVAFGVFASKRLIDQAYRQGRANSREELYAAWSDGFTSATRWVAQGGQYLNRPENPYL